MRRKVVLSPGTLVDEARDKPVEEMRQSERPREPHRPRACIDGADAFPGDVIPR